MTRSLEGGQADLHRGFPDGCPTCGSSSLARILYGEPPADATLEADLQAGRIVLGGCVVDRNGPAYRCRSCGSEFGSTADGSRADGRGRGSFTTRLLPPTPRPGFWRVGRLVLTGAAQSERNPPDRGELLATALVELARQQVHVRFLLTPAGFFEPKSRRQLDLTHGWDTEQADFDRVRNAAAESVTARLTDAFDLARGLVDYFVVGADVHGLGRHAYAETALVYDVTSRELIGSTGKTYPTTEQERKLVRSRDADGHILDVAGERVAVLVCHDLQAWSPRGTASRGRLRAGEAAGLDTALRNSRPTTVLHLPHSTHSAQTWSNSWAEIERILPGVIWASAIKYRKGYSRPPIPLGRELLDRTKSDPSEVLDIILGDHVSI